jgi:hypothetical protein
MMRFIRHNEMASTGPRSIERGIVNPTTNAVKYFARVTLEELCNDPKWVFRARAAINEFWRIKNAGRAAVEYQMSEQPQDTAQRVA